MLKLKTVNFDQRQFQNHQFEPTHQGQAEWLIGRNPTCDLVLSNREVSRVHGRIVWDKTAYYYLDVGSTSGSLLNGDSVPMNDKRLLHVGDLLQIGETFLYVEELASPVSAVDETYLGEQNVPQLPTSRWTEKNLVCYCQRIIQETPDTKTFCFVADPPVLFTYQPGQFVNLEVEIDGKPVMRPYSISSAPTRPYHLSLTIKRVLGCGEEGQQPPGLVSNWMHDRFQVGDRVRFIGGAMGHFTPLPNVPPKLLLISAGSGITPMMSIARWLQDTLSNSDIVFMHSAHTPADIAFCAELEAMAAQMPNFRLALTVTQPQQGDQWMGLRGRVSESMLQFVVPDLSDRAVFVCGPTGFMHDIKSTLATMHFPMHNYLEESFGGSRPSPSNHRGATSSPSDPPTVGNRLNSHHASNGSSHHSKNTSSATALMVSFAKVGKTVTTDGSASILEIAEQEGIAISSACRAGACGACKVRTRSGKVQYATSPTALSAKDEQAGYVLACIAHPMNQVVVEA